MKTKLENLLNSVIHLLDYSEEHGNIIPTEIINNLEDDYNDYITENDKMDNFLQTVPFSLIDNENFPKYNATDPTVLESGSLLTSAQHNDEI